LVIWGKYDLSFNLREPGRTGVTFEKAQVHVLDAGTADTAADEITHSLAVSCRTNSRTVGSMMPDLHFGQ
jgi:hypothetical protein